MNELLKNLKVKKKMNVYGGTMIALIAVLGMVAAIASVCMNMQTRDITDNWMPCLTLTRQLDTLTSNYRLQQYAHINTTDPDEKSTHEEEMYRIDAEITTVRDELESYFTENKEWELLASIDEKWTSYKTQSEELILMSREGREAEARVHMVGDIQATYNDFGDNFDQLVTFEQENTDRSSRESGILFKIVIIIVICFILLSIVIVIILSRTLSNLIIDPLKRVQDALYKLQNNGDLNFSLEYDSKDEFGEMVNAILAFVNALTAIIKDESYLMAQMAEGNFNITSNASELYVGDFEQILISLRGIKNKLGTALASISTSADQVNVASSQLASESQNMADEIGRAHV